ncbi:RsbRD N-terminal domain-containing protein [Kovacikia minuta CCNUW1]|uniref:sensor histidine kinase n=1 Tax=Kovacikia minuta TaxID=2931930 RepID=UPI001CCEDEB6|nr:ATP-binding protein [Kovacikia minuta]UBF28421.1 RsbRD N-terminal domain-containing protein [Kovacikia minuta CCNUW1]
MINFSQLLMERADLIIEQWMEMVQQDRHMKADDTLSPTAVRDHIPLVLRAIATILSRTQTSDIQTLAEASLEHGILRAEQGFDPTEVAREYRLLRAAIFSSLEPELMSGTPAEVYRVFRLIDTVVDEAISQSFKSYVEERVKELEQLQQQVTLGSQEVSRLLRISQDTLSQQFTSKLKVPLNSVIDYANLFLRQQKQITETQDNSPRIDHIERVLHNSRLILRLVNDTTELLRYETGQLQLHLLPTNVSAMIRQTLQTMDSEIAAKNLHVNLECEAAPLQVLTDPLRLQQILTNLLSNAIRYTETGSINILCQELSNHHWLLSIKDTGIGISVENQSQIFEPYFQIDSHLRSPDTEGTGLGLAIVLRLVRLLQGEIQVESEVGVGSTFTVRFSDRSGAISSLTPNTDHLTLL